MKMSEDTRYLVSCLIIVVLGGCAVYFGLHIVFLEQNIYTQEVKFQALKEQTDGTLLDPTFGQVMTFLSEDNTDEHKYDVDNYNCVEFSNQLIFNATKAGLNAYYVSITYGVGEGGHAVVAFNTLDKGYIFVEPQSDTVLHLAVGREYDGKTIHFIKIANSP